MTESTASIEAKLLDAIRYRFSDQALLVRALTHRSYVTDSSEKEGTFERLEFLGDRVLGLIISEHLYTRFPNASEGELSRRLTRLVRGETCAEVAQELDLAQGLRLGLTLARKRNQLQSSILADACESLIAALYLDGGLPVASAFVLHFWQGKVEGSNASERDPKTLVQEYAQKRGYGLPTYELISRSGPDHRPRFKILVKIEEMEKQAEGEGNNKKEAEQTAAEALLASLKA